jgi:hypothetical protein
MHVCCEAAVLWVHMALALGQQMAIVRAVQCFGVIAACSGCDNMCVLTAGCDTHALAPLQSL